MNDIGGVNGVEAFHAAEHDFMWAGYRNGKIVAIFTDAKDAELWLEVADRYEGISD
jgi:hypothetical protein